MFHLIGFLLQYRSWWLSRDFSPQEKQYNVMLSHLYPDLFCLDSETLTTNSADSNSTCTGGTGSDSSGVVGVDGTDVVKGTASSISCIGNNYSVMFRDLTQRPNDSIFSFLEILTVVYVWGELQYPSVYCGSVRPLSLYYYPIVMSLLDLTKFNVYVCTRLYYSKRYRVAVLAVLDFGMFITNTWVTAVLAVMFVVGLATEAFMWVYLRVYYSTLTVTYGSAWPTQLVSSKTASDTCSDLESQQSTINPMALVNLTNAATINSIDSNSNSITAAEQNQRLAAVEPDEFDAIVPRRGPVGRRNLEVM